MPHHLGKTLILAGGVLAAIGVLLLIAPRLPFRAGHLPGDIVFRVRNTTFYFPLATCLLLSLILSLLSWLLRKR